MQEQSWTNLTRTTPGYPYLVGQIFFPLNVASLDSQDIVVLDELAREYQLQLLGRRVEFWFMGHGDQRGTSDYNTELGLRRARAVETAMDGRLSSPFYSSHAATSRGEIDSEQGRVSEERMAEDRRVDIFSSYSRDPHFTEESPLIVTGSLPQVRRIIHRIFSDFSCANTFTRSPGDELWNQVRESIMRGVLGGREAMIAGPEETNRRGISEYPLNFRVNRVVINFTSSSIVNGFADCSGIRAEVEYEWGEVEPRVTVVWNVEHRGNNGRILGAARSDELTLSRNEAESSPFVFPPDPEPNN